MLSHTAPQSWDKTGLELRIQASPRTYVAQVVLDCAVLGRNFGLTVCSAIMSVPAMPHGIISRVGVYDLYQVGGKVITPRIVFNIFNGRFSPLHGVMTVVQWQCLTTWWTDGNTHD